jgi:oxygen-independent coproporphyrinogen III oxidase
VSDPLGLYLHIPFCQAICSYCNFNRGLLDGVVKTRYVAALVREIVAAGDGRAVDTIFFGGGTPSLLAATEVGHILDACRQAFSVAADAEITLETNPETVGQAELEAFRRAGINRVSLGVQSFDDAELQRLGRIHSAERAASVVRFARAAGFDNMSMDLMCWLPGQTLGSWRTSLDQAIALEPDHVSFYLLELYPNAPLQEAMARVAARPTEHPGNAQDWAQVEEDAAADMYLEGMARLDAAGYEQYEISNSARPDRQSRHNLKYWTMGDWWGFGCGAHSTVDGRRWRNVSSTGEYIASVESARPVALGERLMSVSEQTEEALFTGLRLSAGVDLEHLAIRYGARVWDQYGDNLAAWIAGDLMWRRGARVGLTRRGMLVSNEILATFV